MTILIDLAVAAAALLAAAYCLLLSRRLRALTQLDGDVGSAIALLSQQVDALTAALQSASQTSNKAGEDLKRSLARAETTTRNLELLLAASRATPSGRSGHDTDMPDRAMAPSADSVRPLHSRPATPQGTSHRPRVVRQRITEGARG